MITAIGLTAIALAALLNDVDGLTLVAGADGAHDSANRVENRGA